MCRLCGLRQCGGQGRDATRGLRSHEIKAAHRSACVRLPISNYLHTRITFVVRKILESREISWIFFSKALSLIVTASLFLSLLRRTLYLSLQRTVVNNFSLNYHRVISKIRMSLIFIVKFLAVLAVLFLKHFHYSVLKNVYILIDR